MSSRPIILAATVGLAMLLLGLIGVVTFMAAKPAAAPPLTPAGPDAAGSTLPGGISATDAALKLADQSIGQGEFTAAIARLEKAVISAPKHQGLRLKLAEALIHNAQSAAALLQLEEAIAIGPESPALHFDTGTVAAAAGKPEQAIKHYEIAQIKSPTDSRIPLYLAMVRLKQGEDTKARAALVRAVTLSPDLAEGWGTLADISLRENSLDLAQQHVTKARTLQPESPQWKLVEARIKKRSNSPQTAAELLMTLPDDQRLTLPVLQTLSECFGLISRNDLAAEQYTLAAERDRTSGPLALQAAKWQLKAGHSDRARDLAITAKRLGVEGADDLIARLDAANLR